jgi:predicted GNAT family N-acyltransferase
MSEGAVSSSPTVLECPVPCPSDLRDAIGRLRTAVWSAEGSLDPTQFPSGVWWDSLDDAPGTRHWVAVAPGEGPSGLAVVASARLTWHESFDDDYRDVQLWRRAGVELPLPTCDLGRLVVHKDFRGRGIAQQMNTVRVAAARAMAARSVMVTASEANARLLQRIGFHDIGERVVFSDRPNTTFHALQLNF